MISLSLDELKLIVKSRNIKDCKDNSENDLIKILSELKPKIILYSELRHGFSKSKINEFKRNQSFYIRNKRD